MFLVSLSIRRYKRYSA